MKRLIYKKSNLMKSLIQFTKFGIVGLSNAIIAYSVYYVLLVLIGANYILANSIGFIASVINAFYWNNKYVFVCQKSEKRSIARAFIKTFISYASTGLIINSILLYLWIDIIGLNSIFAPLINIIITTPINFILNKIWTFKRI